MTMVCSDSFWNTNALGCGSSNTNPNTASTTTPDVTSNTVQYYAAGTIVLGVGGTWRLPAVSSGSTPSPPSNDLRFRIHSKTPAATILDVSALSLKNPDLPATPEWMDLPTTSTGVHYRVTVWNLSQYPTYILVDSPRLQNGATVMGVAKSIGVRGGESVQLQYDPLLNQWHHADL